MNNDRLTQKFESKLFLHLLGKSLWLLILLTACAIGAGMLIVRYTPPEYQSVATIQYAKEDRAQKVLSISNFDEDNKLSEDIELLNSKKLIDLTLKHIPVELRYYRQGEILEMELYRTNPFTIIDFQLIDSGFYNAPIYVNYESSNATPFLSFIDHDSERKIEIDETGHYRCNKFECKLITSKYQIIGKDIKENNRYYFKIEHPGKLSREFKKTYQSRILNSKANTIKIEFRNQNKKLCQDYVQGIIKAYIEYDKNRQTTSTANIVRYISAQKDSVEKKLQESERLIQVFKDRNDIKKVEGASEKLLARIEHFEDELIKLELDEQLILKIESSLESAVKKLEVYDIVPLIFGSAFEETLRVMIEDLQQLIIQKIKVLRSNTNQSEKINEINQQIETQIGLVNSAIDAISENIANRKNQIQLKLDEFESKFYSLPEVELEYSKLNRIYSINENFFSLLTEKETEYAMFKAGVTSGIQILEEPNFPEWPVSPRKTLIFSGLILCVIIGYLLLVTIQYFLHDQIGNLEDINKLSESDVSTLGIVPKYGVKTPVSQLVIDIAPKSLVAESFRSIRTNMEFLSSHEGTKLAAVTSTISGEGKTFVAINLGGIVAFSGKKAIILDLDMRKPKIHVGFNVENATGMSNLLIGKANVKDCIKSTTLENLDFITAGPVPPNPSELIINGELDKIVEELKKSYDLIIFDSPPSGLVTDGIPILQLVDYPIYVFRQNYSKRNFTKNLDKLIVENRISKLSVVLNSVDISSRSYRYGYGYGYTYGQGYYGEEQTNKRASIFTKKFSNSKK